MYAAFISWEVLYIVSVSVRTYSLRRDAIYSDNTVATAGAEGGEDDSSVCSLSLDSSRPETQDYHYPDGLHYPSRGGDVSSGGGGCTMSLTSFAMDSQSVSSMSVSEERPLDTASVSHMPLRGSSGPGWAGYRGLRSVFTRAK